MRVGATSCGGGAARRCGDAAPLLLAHDLLAYIVGEEAGVEGFDTSTYGERFADVYDEWYADITDVAATVATVAALAGDGPVIELGVGTGRLALPLAAAGVEVWGVDASPSMLERLRAKPGAAAVHALEGDFAALDDLADLPHDAAVVLVAFNTFFNLADADAQRRCLAGVARRLRPGGRLVVEAVVPELDPAAPRGVVAPLAVDADRVVLHVTLRGADPHTVAGQHVTITEDGIRLRPWLVRYATPDELDAMAAEVGLDREDRWADWHRRPFTGDDDRHVTVYRRP